VTTELVRQATAEQLAKLNAQFGSGKFAEAGRIFEEMMTTGEFPEFLTSAAYGSLE
jgi:hypothetical protein